MQDAFDQRKPAKIATYILVSPDGTERRFSKMLAAREEAERLMAERGLGLDGWREEERMVWYLLPGREYSIRMVVA